MLYGRITEWYQTQVASLFISHLTTVNGAVTHKGTRLWGNSTGTSFAQPVKQGAALVANLCKREAQECGEEGVAAEGKMTGVLSQKNKQPALFLEVQKPWDFSHVAC